MHDNLELVARPEEVLEAHMDKGLVCRTQAETSVDHPVAARQLANLEPLPYTLLVKGKFWYFRTRQHGTIRIEGEYRSRRFMQHYHRLCREHGKHPEIQAGDRRAVYFLGREGGPVKIGITGSDRDRLTTLQNGCPYKLEIFATAKGGRAMELAYHRRFRKHHMRGEWFTRCPQIEAEITRLKTERL